MNASASSLVATAHRPAAFAAAAQDKVVYHIDDAATQALKGLRNIRNHLDTDPTRRSPSSRMPTASTS